VAKNPLLTEWQAIPSCLLRLENQAPNLHKRCIAAPIRKRKRERLIQQNPLIFTKKRLSLPKNTLSAYLLNY
jgi:hypothetical protein